MSKDKPEQQVFDVERIRELIELMKEHELNEVDRIILVSNFEIDRIR